MGGKRPVSFERRWSSYTSQVSSLAFLLLLHFYIDVSSALSLPSLQTLPLVTCKSDSCTGFALSPLVEQTCASCRIKC